METLSCLSMLKSGKDPTLPSSCRPISLLDYVGKLFEMVLLTRVMWEMNLCRLLHDRQLGFDPHTVQCCSWPILLKESLETLAGRG